MMSYIPYILWSHMEDMCAYECNIYMPLSSDMCTPGAMYTYWQTTFHLTGVYHLINMAPTLYICGYTLILHGQIDLTLVQMCQNTTALSSSHDTGKYD